jgi:sugar fermentation stimulation protein A
MVGATRESAAAAGDGLVEGRWVARPNRFVVKVELAGGEVVAAHLPNTGRLTHLMAPGRRFLLRPSYDAHRKTRFTATRAWDGTWVALEAARAPAVLAAWLAGRELGPLGAVADLRSEVRVGRHRIDLAGRGSEGVVWIEVKSGGRTEGDVALLSQTPSTRAAAHLELLEELVAGGARAAAVFVVQRSDVRALLVGGDADAGWIAAVRSAAAGGVQILAYGCDVTPDEVSIARELPVVGLGDAVRSHGV